MRKLLLLSCIAAVTAMAANIYTFDVPNPTTTTDSSGHVVSGWGYSIANESDSLWLVLTNLTAGSFQFADPASLFDFPIVAPGHTSMEPYDQLIPAGLYQITWHADAPPGFVNAGSFNVIAEWWQGDPLAGGSFVSAAPSLSQPYSVSPSAVPEPATGVLVAFALLLVTFGKSAVRRLITQKRRA
jgi:hypothetical protein